MQNDPDFVNCFFTKLPCLFVFFKLDEQNHLFLVTEVKISIRFRIRLRKLKLHIGTYINWHMYIHIYTYIIHMGHIITHTHACTHVVIMCV